MAEKEVRVSDLMHEMADMFAAQCPGRNPELLRMLREAAEDEREKELSGNPTPLAEFAAMFDSAYEQATGERGGLAAGC